MDDKDTVPDLGLDEYSVTMASSTIPYYSGTVTIGSSGSMLTSAGLNGTSWSTGPYIYSSNVTSPQPGLKVSGDTEFEGDVKIKGRSLEKLLTTIEDRLAILQDPDPAKLEKYAALKKAYDHYKTLERLIGED
jgi:hypothetical protein